MQRTILVIVAVAVMINLGTGTAYDQKLDRKKPDQAEIRRAVAILGLKLSDQEISQLQDGKQLSLEKRSLSEVGQVLIRADALAKTIEKGKDAQQIRSVGDLKKTVEAAKDRGCSGIKVHCWNNGKCCLYVTWPIGLCVHCDL